MSQLVSVSIIGASGYTGGELLRLLLAHPRVELVAVTSRQEAGKPLSTVFPRFRSLPGAELAFIAPDPDAIAATGAEVAFLALPPGVAAEIARALLEDGHPQPALAVIHQAQALNMDDPNQEFSSLKSLALKMESVLP